MPQAVPNVLPALGNYLVAGFKDAPLGSSIQVTGILAFATAVAGRSFRCRVEPYTLIGIGFLTRVHPCRLRSSDDSRGASPMSASAETAIGRPHSDTRSGDAQRAQGVRRQRRAATISTSTSPPASAWSSSVPVGSGKTTILRVIMTFERTGLRHDPDQWPAPLPRETAGSLKPASEAMSMERFREAMMLHFTVLDTTALEDITLPDQDHCQTRPSSWPRTARQVGLRQPTTRPVSSPVVEHRVASPGS